MSKLSAKKARKLEARIWDYVQTIEQEAREQEREAHIEGYEARHTTTNAFNRLWDYLDKNTKKVKRHG